MVQMAFCDLLYVFHKQVLNISQHVFVILLWEILTPPLTEVESNDSKDEGNHFPLYLLKDTGN